MPLGFPGLESRCAPFPTPPQVGAIGPVDPPPRAGLAGQGRLAGQARPGGFAGAVDPDGDQASRPGPTRVPVAQKGSYA